MKVDAKIKIFLKIALDPAMDFNVKLIDTVAAKTDVTNFRRVLKFWM